jgi:hypothetical protein
MIHKIIIPNNQTVNLSFTFPDTYIGKEVEIIAFTKGEGQESQLKKKVSFDALSLDTRGFKFNRDEANER